MKITGKAKGSYKRAIDKAVAHFMEQAEGIKLCISTGNSKIGHALNVSLPCGAGYCGNCSGCSAYCYDIRDGLRYGKNVINARARNYALLKKDRDNYFEQIAQKMTRRRKNFYLRFHVGGEIPDYDYFCRMVEIARAFPHFTIWTYTKMYGFVNLYVMEHGGTREKAIPANLHIMFSEWYPMPITNPYNFPEFRFVPKEKQPNPDIYICPGNCDICKAAGRGCIAGETTQGLEH